MTYIPKYSITDTIRHNLREIDRLHDKIRGARILPEAEASIHLRASVEQAHSSTSIEGNPLNANQVRAVLASEKPLTKEQYAEREVKNYRAALDFIDERRNGDPEITIEDVLKLHELITEGLLSAPKSGHFRKNPVYIENQNHEVLYAAARPQKVEAEVKALLNWVKENQVALHPALISGIIHLQLVAIHPFSDGNGRTSRALTMLYLALNRYDCDGSLVLDTYYAENRQEYYHALEEVCDPNFQTAMKADLTPWLEYFTDGFVASLHVLAAEIKIAELITPTSANNTLDRSDHDLLSYVATFGSIGTSEAEAILPELSRRGIQRRLQELVSLGYLRKVGETKGARYYLSNSSEPNK